MTYFRKNPYYMQFQKFKTLVDRYEELWSKARCLEGEDCETCIYNSARGFLGHRTCALMHKRHISEDDLKKLREKYPNPPKEK